ncbi:outer membrane protein assembly factor BamC [Crenothrix sp.]|uniref:outer membrane protein assembly factor BamC n=1 Tax=Crenothrix sp. TaxID=3100433 RepID=UPI00374D91AA
MRAIKTKIILITVAGYIAGNLTACSHVTKLFPDKERDYQHTKEIPMLNWPKDLRDNPTPAPKVAPAASSPSPDDMTPSPGSPVPTSENSAPASDIASEIPEQARPPSEADPVPDETGDTTKPIAIEKTQQDGSSQLRFNVPMLRAWRAIDKALSRNSIEVTKRNPEEHRYTVQYDPDEKKFEDGSLMDEVKFLFKGFQTNEQEYRLQLIENSDHVTALIVDSDKKPLADTAASVKLLDTLEKTIKENFSETKK